MHIIYMDIFRKSAMPENIEPDISLGFLMHDVSRLMRRNFNRRAQEMGLTITQGRVIIHLERNEGLSQVELASVLEVQPITLTRLIDRMEDSQWVERRPHPSDRRAVQLFLTDKIQPMLADIKAMLRQTLEETISGIAEGRQHQFLETLGQMKQTLLDTENREDASDAG